MVLGCGNEVARTCLNEKVHHRARIDLLRVPHVRKILVGGSDSVLLVVANMRRAVRNPHCIGIPLGVGMHCVFVIGLYAFFRQRCPGGNRVETPVNENAEFGILEPVGHIALWVGWLRRENRAGAMFEINHEHYPLSFVDFFGGLNE